MPRERLPARLSAALALLLLLAACAQRPTPTETVPVPSPSAVVAVAVVRDAAPDAPHESRATAPPYDFAADLAARNAAVKARFGPHTRTRVVQEAFLLVEVGARSPLFERAVGLVDRAVPAMFNGQFTKRPHAGVTVLLYTDGAAFQAYRAQQHPDAGSPDWGSYDEAHREIVVDLSGGAAFLPTLTHEIVHAILDTDFTFAPLWLAEGLASLYEAPVFTADGGIRGEPKNRRHPRLLAALASPRERGEVSLGALFAMDANAFDARTDAGVDGARRSLHYAMARAMVAWMQEKGVLWAWYRTWRDGYLRGVTGEGAFREVVGMSVGEVEAAWVAWVRGL